MLRGKGLINEVRVKPRFSIVVPVHNEAERLPRLLRSLESQTLSRSDFEVVLIDSASTDRSVKDVGADFPELGLISGQLLRNEGPGIARNAGILMSSADWVIFVDADDELEFDALERLDRAIADAPSTVELIGFNWRPADAAQPQLARRDHRYFESQCLMLRQYSRHHVDGSVIFTAFKADLLRRESVEFDPGLHEDVMFMFRAYAGARGMSLLEDCLYVKHRHPTSVTQTISPQHIDGFISGYEGIEAWWADHVCPGCAKTHLDDAQVGVSAAYASRAREVVRRCKDPQERLSLINYLRRRLSLRSGSARGGRPSQPRGETYAKIFEVLCDVAIEPIDVIWQIERLDGQSLSCADLHESVFMAPNEVRTCCKRFFVGGEIRGDARLGITIREGEAISAEQLWTAKRDLWVDINTGEASPCDQCPYLERKAWEPIESVMPIRHMSMEQHSVCNLRCTYCDDTYYGGERSRYNVLESLRDFAAKGSLSECRLVVWGGGEPTLEPEFESVLETVAGAAPSAQHRVLTNALRYSPPVHRIAKDRRGQILTSVDAGSAGTFQRVRGRRGLEKVLTNLRRYAEDASERLTVKYIVTDDNYSAQDTVGFLDLVTEAELLGCYFQISGDFKIPQLSRPMVEAAVRLYLGLLARNARGVYFDEHVWVRWTAESANGVSESVLDGLTTSERDLVGKPGESNVALWGTGQLARILMERPGFAERWGIKTVVDSYESRIGAEFFGRVVADPKSLLTIGDQVFLCGVQGYVHMHEEVLAIGLEASRIERRLLW